MNSERQQGRGAAGVTDASARIRYFVVWVSRRKSSVQLSTTSS
jgi:hypothetical protein